MNETTNSLRLMRKVLNHLLPNKSCTCTCNSYSKTSSTLNADLFNDYFTSIGLNLTNDFGVVTLPKLNIIYEIEFQFKEINQIVFFDQIVLTDQLPGVNS